MVMLPFETLAERALRATRSLSRRISALYQLAYENVEGETVSAAGNDAGPYFNALGRAALATQVTQIPSVATGEPQIVLTDEHGRLWVRNGDNPSSAWEYFDSDLGTSAVDAAVSADPAVIGRISVTLDEAADLYLIVFDGADATAPVIDRFYVPGASTAGTAMVDYTGLGGRPCSTGIFLALSTAPGAVVAPATGGFFHVTFRGA